MQGHGAYISLEQEEEQPLVYNSRVPLLIWKGPLHCIRSRG